ncbi:MAG: choice-of-anchor Q domain-containing protein [Lysobacterales bacterium]
MTAGTSKLIGCVFFCLAQLSPAQVLAEPALDSSIALQRTLTVTTVMDSGPGSLRAALEEAGKSSQPYKIVFGSADGPFSTPRVIELSAPLPAVTGTVDIDGFIPGLLWKSYGVTISGAGKYRVLEVASGGDLRVSGITVRDGKARAGAGVFNQGRLVVEGVTLLFNQADDAGGAIANQNGTVFLINSTAVSNRAERGGAVANLAGELRATNVTMDGNEAVTGSDIFSLGQLTLVNSILTGADEQCVNSGPLTKESTHNLFTSATGCGKPLITADPLFQTLDHYNGPTPTLPISGASPARNLGDNKAAVDAAGNPLIWDQRGNGDPRFAGGYVDIGAFEHQSQLASEFVVDTLVDTGLRGCTKTGTANCPLRAAVELSIAGRHMVPVRFDPGIFTEPQVLELTTIPAGADLRELVFDGVDSGGITIIVPQAVPWHGTNGVTIKVDTSVTKSVP